jgi:hypothetical protein
LQIAQKTLAVHNAPTKVTLVAITVGNAIATLALTLPSIVIGNIVSQLTVDRAASIGYEVARSGFLVTRTQDQHRQRRGRGPAMVSTSPPVLAADLNAGLKRLKMAAMRRLAPELLVTAKTQRWSPEEFLRTLVEAEIAARDASNAATRRRQAGFPVTKILDDYDLTASSVQQARSR